MEYLKIVQSTLNIDLNDKKLEKYNPSPLMLQQLSEKFDLAYADYKMPEKNNRTLRPYLSPRSKIGSVSMKYTFNANEDKLLNSYPLEEAVKRSLLYANEICIQDPLRYLLDYFAANPLAIESQNRIPIIKHILIELSRIKPLIDNNIVHIISDEVFYKISDYDFLMQVRNMDNLEGQIKERSGEKFDDFLFEELIRSLYEQYMLNQNVDLFLPNNGLVDMYKMFLNIYDEKYTSDKIKTHSRLEYLGGLQLVSTDKLTAKDIIAIRESDKVFEQWQLLVKETLDELSKNEGEYTDSDLEFKKIILEQNQKLELYILKQAAKSKFWGNMDKFREKVSIGLVSFSILNLLLPADLSPGLGSINNTLFSAFLEQLFTLKSDAKTRKVKKSVSNHFLTIK